MGTDADDAVTPHGNTAKKQNTNHHHHGNVIHGNNTNNYDYYCYE